MAGDVRMRGFRDRAEVADVVRLLETRLAPLTAETVELRQAARRVLAEDAIAGVAVPGFDRAAMDGYALRGAETFGASPYNPLELAVIGVILPGRPLPGSLGPGQAARIMTGAPLPAGADAVLQAENAEEFASPDGPRVRITDAVPPGRHVGRVGEDIQTGNVLLRRGRRLRPQDLGVLASVGAGMVRVVRRPRVAILITGDELLPCGSRPEGFRIVDSNSVMLAALVERDAGEVARLTLLPDREETIRTALAESAGDCDVVLISGGSSVGQEDHAPRQLAQLGELPVHGVALRPASPAGVGFVAGRPVFLMPGNPVSCLCAYDLFVSPALRKLGGLAANVRLPLPAGPGPLEVPADWPYRTAELPLARKIVSPVGRVDYVRVQVTHGQVEPLATSGAAILSSTTRADGFVLVPRDSEGHAPGERVLVSLYD